MKRILSIFFIAFSVFSLSVPAWADDAATTPAPAPIPVGITDQERSQKSSLDGFDVKSIFSVTPNKEGEPSETITADFIKEAETSGSVIEAVILRVINILMLFVGTVAMILLMAGGLTWVTADGEEGKVDRGEAIITQTLLGLVFTLLSYVIVTFVVSFFYQ